MPTGQAGLDGSHHLYWQNMSRSHDLSYTAAAELKETLLSGKPTPITYQTPTTSEALLKEDKEIESFRLPLNRERLLIVKAQELFEK